MNASRNLERMRPHLLYMLLLLAGTAYLVISALLQHRALGTGYDLGIYDQTIWNLAHGRIWMTTLVYETGGYYDHFEPILALIAPLYWLWSDVRVLLIVQSVALGLGALPIYLYARRRFKAWEFGRVLALVIAAAYLVYPAMHNANLNDFHEVSLLPPLLGFALYGLLTGRRRVTWVFLILCLMVKEDFSVTFLMFGLYIVAFNPAGFRRRDGVFVAATAIVWMLLVLYLFYPAATRGMPYPFVARRYPWLGDSPESAATVLLTQPWIMLPYLTQAPKLLFALRLIGPLLFLPLLGWPVIGLAIPVLIYLMLSNYEPQWSVQSYYNPPLLPTLFFGLMTALSHIHRRLSARAALARIGQIGMVCLIAGGVGVGYWLDAPGPGSRNFTVARFAVTPRVEAARRIMAQIPADASVSAVWPLVPQLSQRQRIYTVLARPAIPTDFIALEETPGAEGAPIYPYAAPPRPSGAPPVYHEYAPVAAEGSFRLLAYRRAITLTELAELEPPPAPLNLAGYIWLDQSNDPPTVKAGETARLMLAWQRTGSLNRRYVVFVHLLKDGSPAAANGLPDGVTQSGHEPGDGRFPTTQWETWTRPPIVLDEQRLEIPPQTPAGVYYAWAGAYDKESGERIELDGPGRTLRLVGPLRVIR
jgi:uncharacterized membrane protein